MTEEKLKLLQESDIVHFSKGPDSNNHAIGSSHSVTWSLLCSKGSSLCSPLSSGSQNLLSLTNGRECTGYYVTSKTSSERTYGPADSYGRSPRQHQQPKVSSNDCSSRFLLSARSQIEPTHTHSLLRLWAQSKNECYHCF